MHQQTPAANENALARQEGLLHGHNLRKPAAQINQPKQDAEQV
jgi:hypothetical protein